MWDLWIISKKIIWFFKIRDMKQKRNTGARCDQASKPKSIKILKRFGRKPIHHKKQIN